MTDKILNPDTWELLPLESQIDKKTTGESSESRLVNAWRNSPQLISPLSLYKYLKAKFGLPNGLIMLAKNQSSDNLIHWHYSLLSANIKIDIIGKTTGLEIVINGLPEKTLTEKHWLVLITNLNACFKKISKEMKDTQAEFEEWALFINPFYRIERTLQDHIRQLEELDLTEVSEYTLESKESFDKYTKDLDKWVENTSKAASLGITIRMLCPVMAEAFVNLILLIFRKEEYKRDERLYDSLLRQQIDIRVKTLHIHCICFPEQIDSKTEAFKKFHSLMNRRNDFLHGNINPDKLMVEDVWFDQHNIPLFDKDEGVIRKMTRNYCTNIEPEKAIGDFQIVSDLIELVLMAMDEESFRAFLQIMSDRMPGINKKTKRLGVLFPTTHLVESFAY